MLCDNTSRKIRSSPAIAELIRGICFDRLTSSASHHPTPTVWDSISGVRTVALILAGVSCAFFSGPVNAGFVVSDGLNPDQNIASPKDVLLAPGYTGLQYGGYDFGRLSNKPANRETQNFEEKPACSSARPMEIPAPFQTPMSNVWDSASFGPGFTELRRSRTRAGGGSAGLLSENGKSPKPPGSCRRNRQEFQFIPDAPPSELRHPS